MDDDTQLDHPSLIQQRPRDRAYSELYQLPEVVEFENHHLNLNHFEVHDCLSQQRSNEQAYFELSNLSKKQLRAKKFQAKRKIKQNQKEKARLK
jgi:hypothetical protein